MSAKNLVNEKGPAEMLVEKWAPVIDKDPSLPGIKDPERLAVTAQLLENEDRALTESASVNTAQITSYDPVLMQIVRRSSPQLIAYDVAGLQTMKMPTGVIFAMKANYVMTPAIINMTPGVAGAAAVNGPEALFNEADTSWSGSGPQIGTNPFDGSTYITGTGQYKDTAETSIAAQMGISIEKVTVEAKTRQLRGSASIELRQDLAAVHGLDADAEMANILSQELLFETNRELIRTIYTAAKVGAQTTFNPGIFDLLIDSDGRWAGERIKGLILQIQRDANQIGIETRRGKGNGVLVSATVGSALALAGVLTYAPGLEEQINFRTVDVTGPTYVGNLQGIKVYVDPYVTGDGYCVFYKGANPKDAGIFFAPYVLAQMFQAVDSVTFAPALGMKSRYAIVANPFTTLNANENVYYRKAAVFHI